jgi:transcriptional regulator with GAF, ATPase, and Fis domain
MRSVASTLEAALLRQQVEAAEHEQRVLSDALRDTAAALTSTLDPAAVLTRVLEDVGCVVPHDAANIMLIEGNSTHAIHWRGYTDQQPVQTANFPLDAPSLRQMIATGAPYVVADTRADPNWLVIPNTDWIRSYLGHQAHGVIIGFEP